MCWVQSRCWLTRSRALHGEPSGRGFPHRQDAAEQVLVLAMILGKGLRGAAVGGNSSALTGGHDRVDRLPLLGADDRLPPSFDWLARVVTDQFARDAAPAAEARVGQG